MKSKFGSVLFWLFMAGMGTSAVAQSERFYTGESSFAAESVLGSQAYTSGVPSSGSFAPPPYSEAFYGGEVTSDTALDPQSSFANSNGWPQQSLMRDSTLTAAPGPVATADSTDGNYAGMPTFANQVDPPAAANSITMVQPTPPVFPPNPPAPPLAFEATEEAYLEPPPYAPWAQFGVTGAEGMYPSSAAPAAPSKVARFWIRSELLLWFLEGLDNGPLVASNPAGTPEESVGLPGYPSTRPIFGRNLGDGLRVGGRFSFGRWLGCDNRRAIQGELFGLGSQGNSFDSDRVDADILSRPFTNTDIGGADAQIFQMAGLTNGRLTMDFNSDLWSAGIGMRRQLCCNSDPCNPCSSRRLDLLCGYRYVHLGEDFRAQETLSPVDPRFVPGTTLTLDDEIRTRNDFHGFEFGLQSSTLRNRWTAQVSSLVAIGQVRNRVRLAGSTTSTVPGFANETIGGGLIVGPDMVGTGESQEFGVVPQARVNFGYFLTRNLQFNAGYNFLYFFDVVRPDSFLDVTRAGSGISRRVPAVPARTDLPTPDDGVWLHGASLGLTFTW